MGDREVNDKDIMAQAEKNADERIKALKEENSRRKKALIKIAAMGALTIIIMVLATIAWFSMNSEVTAEGMSVKSASMPFELETEGDKGLYDSLLDETVSGYGDDSTTAGSAGIKWRLTKNESELNNVYDGEGEPDMSQITRHDSSDYGLKPGDSGSINFFIKPNVESELNIRLSMAVTGYKATFALGDDDVYYKTDDELTEVEDDTVKALLSRHICFFYVGDDNKKHLLTDEGFNVKVSERTPVTLYWVWPATLKEIIEGDIEGLDDETAANEVRRAFFEKPEEFLKTLGNEPLDEFRVESMEDKAAQDAAIESKLSLVSGRNYNKYGAMYDDADQAVGDNVNYILAELSADGG